MNNAKAYEAFEKANTCPKYGADYGDIGFFLNRGLKSEAEYFTWGYTFTQMVFNGDLDAAYPWAKEEHQRTMFCTRKIQKG